MDDCNKKISSGNFNRRTSSDSSMDDCNSVQQNYPLSIRGSDSSMDDCNTTDSDIDGTGDDVQIPLWTIVTQFFLLFS